MATKQYAVIHGPKQNYKMALSRVKQQWEEQQVYSLRNDWICRIKIWHIRSKLHSCMQAISRKSEKRRAARNSSMSSQKLKIKNKQKKRRFGRSISNSDQANEHNGEVNQAARADRARQAWWRIHSPLDQAAAKYSFTLRKHKALRWKAAAVQHSTWKNQFMWSVAITESAVKTGQRWGHSSHKWKIREYLDTGHYKMNLIMQQSRSSKFSASRQRKWSKFSQRRACQRCRRITADFEQEAKEVLKLLIRGWRFSCYASANRSQLVEVEEQVTRSVNVLYGPEEEILDAYPTGVTDTAHSRQFRVSVAFLAGASVMIGWDTCSMVDLVDPDYLPCGVIWTSDKKTAVRGLGGVISYIEGTVRLETLSLAVGGKCRGHPMKVLKPPRGVAILFGIPSIIQMKAIMALHRERIFLEDHKEWVHVDLLQRTIGRMSMEGVCALSSCDGMATPTIVLRELGIPIKEYRAVESNAKIREIARSVFPDIVHIPPHDVNKVRYECIAGNCADGTPYVVNIFFGSPICVPWSGARQNPGGYNEQEAKTFTSTGKLREICMEQNPKCASFIENVKLHPAVADQAERQEQEVGLSFEPSNVVENQSSNSRPRRIATDMVEYATAVVSKHLCPAWLLDGDFFPMQHPMPCLVARGDDTHMPVVLISAWNNEQRFATADEKDRMQGYCTGITHGFFKANGEPSVIVELSLRVRLTGNSFNYEHVYMAVQAWSDSVVNKPAYCLSVIDDDRRDYDKFELFLTNMTHEQKVTWAKKQLADKGGLKQLRLKLQKEHNVGFKTRRRIPVTAALQDAADAKMDSMIEDDKSHLEVPWSDEMWIHDLIWIKKLPERIDAMTGKAALRCIGVYCPINAALEFPQYWAEESPNMSTMTDEVPSDCVWQIPSDAKDAYHAITVHVDSRKYLGLQYFSKKRQKERIVVPSKMPPGLSPSGLFYPVWCHDGYNMILGQVWRKWWRSHIDDTLTFSPTEARTWNRYYILIAVQEAMGIKQSPKQLPVCARTTLHAGLTWTNGRIRAPESVKLVLVRACEAKPNNCRQFRKTCGVIRQCTTALNFSPGELTAFGDLMAVVEEGLKTGKYSVEIGEALTKIASHIGDVDWYYMDPNEVVSDTRSLLALSDISQYCIGRGLFSVAVADASKITVDMLSDPSMCRLISLSHKKLTTAQQAWHSSELELNGGVDNIIKHSKFITSCTARFPVDGPPKIAIATDSRPALGKWKIMRMPHLQKLDFLQIKVQRMLGWIEDTQIMRTWPVCWMHMDGELILVIDFISRMAEFMLDEVDRRTALKAAIKLHSVRGYGVADEADPADESYATELVEDASCYSCPVMVDRSVHLPEEAYRDVNVGWMKLSVTQWSLLAEAQKLCTTVTFNKVTLADIYKALSQGMKEVHPLVRKRVAIWSASGRVALVKTAEMEQPVVVMNSSASVVDGKDELSQLMVPVLPAKVMIQVTGAPRLFGVDKDTPEWMLHDLRLDLLLFVHEFNQHATLDDMLLQLKRLAFWPNMEKHAAEHFKYCIHCLTHCSVHRDVGLSIRTSIRFDLLLIDAWILPTEAQKRTGCHAVMTMVDKAGGLTIYAVLRDMTAQCAATALFIHWLQHYGWPKELRSDNAPEYAGYVMQSICEMFGIKKTFVAVGNSRAMGSCETQHNPLAKAVTEALSKGELRNEVDLQILCATSSIGTNQMKKRDDECASFQLYFGQPANTVFTAVSTTADLTEYDSVQKKDKPFVKAMLRPLVRLNKWHMTVKQSASDAKARANMMLRDISEAKQHKKNFSAELVKGSPVSYKGVTWELGECEGNMAGKPITAILLDKTGKKKSVKFEDLRPLGSHRPQKLLPRGDDDYTAGDFLFFDVDDQVFSGKVLSVAGMQITVQDHDFDEGKDTWYPLYMVKGLATAAYSKPKNCPASTSVVHRKAVFLKGQISKTHRLSDATKKALDARMALSA